MGIITSSVRAIEIIRFEPMPKSWKLANVRFATVDHANYMIRIGKDGLVYTNHRDMSKNMALSGTSSDYGPILALVALGVITKQQAEAHGERAAQRARAMEIAHAALETFDSLKKAGIALTKSQRQKIAEMRAITKQNIENFQLPYWFAIMHKKSPILDQQA